MDRRDWVIIGLLVGFFILIRSLHFTASLNFSADQALSTIRSFELWQDKKISLVGPPASFQFQGRNILFGSITYYFQLFFLLPANFDPILAGFLFMVFCSAMVGPLYIGTWLLSNRKGAVFVTAAYVFLPYYVDYTRFFWAPNFQFALTPILVLLLGLYKAYQKKYLVFFLGGVSGLLALFHYQFAVIILGLAIYLSWISKKKALTIGLFLAGVIVGFLPQIIFELKNDFYNCRTLLLFVNNYREVFLSRERVTFPAHYFLTSSLFILLASVVVVVKKIDTRLLVVIVAGLVIYSLVRYIPKPSYGFGMVSGWSYPDEVKVNQIVREQKVTNFNIINLGYETVASVQKYLLLINGIKINGGDYYNNQYLFVVTDKYPFQSDPAYEVNTFVPAVIDKTWKINPRFSLYLLQRE